MCALNMFAVDLVLLCGQQYQLRFNNYSFSFCGIVFYIILYVFYTDMCPLISMGSPRLHGLTL